MASINQTILIRTDLFQLPEDVGLLSAQVAHIHFELSRRLYLYEVIQDGTDKVPFLSIEKYNEWLKQPYLLVKQVPNLEALRYFQAEATKKDIVVSEWFDTVYVRLSKTKQQAFPNVLVGISLGPDDADVIRTVVGDLPLL